VQDGIAAALAHDGPTLVDSVVNRQELAMPPAISLSMAKGFSLLMVDAVLNGQASEMQIAGSTAAGTYGDLTGRMRLGARCEGRHLLVRDMHPFDPAWATQRIDQPKGCRQRCRKRA
jgi:hypothetical protein